MVNTFLSTHGSFLAPRVESIDVPTLPGRFYQVWRLNEELREKENTILRHHLGTDSQNVKIDIVQIVANTPRGQGVLVFYGIIRGYGRCVVLL